ncbi:alpha/beta fold hydrolase [Saliterribacillus persicus]|uniref:Pimeloyl-ACP methyl ester carboxylesterase n=1 Tax=Saliterribacillus persicus TaxID=930114 RepID=A0A368YAT3_9BACI|nr:alpha/beta hydrolase [Saliterribacillus persicus]RCW76809.1 pimeloyl-ACP methyl ester carboxylesterase [Saliterribacillus persicus]
MVLNYQEYGDKNASLLVFLHGGGVSSWMWDRQVEYFSNYHCITIDLPEQGDSEDTEEFSIQLSAEKINDLIEKIANDKKVTVVGFSLGAQVIIQMLSLNSSLADYAIINSALVRPNSIIRKIIKPSIKISYPLVKNKSFSKLQAKTLYIGEEYFDTYYKESSQMKPDTLIRILEENMSFKIPETFNKAKCKILVTVGDKEKSVMKKSAIDLVSSNSNCTGIIIPKVGHGISLVNPVFFNQLIENWIQKNTITEDVITIQ